jgi:hypothetical protein
MVCPIQLVLSAYYKKSIGKKSNLFANKKQKTLLSCTWSRRELDEGFPAVHCHVTGSWDSFLKSILSVTVTNGCSKNRALIIRYLISLFSCIIYTTFYVIWRKMPNHEKRRRSCFKPISRSRLNKLCRLTKIPRKPGLQIACLQNVAYFVIFGETWAVFIAECSVTELPSPSTRILAAKFIWTIFINSVLNKTKYNESSLQRSTGWCFTRKYSYSWKRTKAIFREQNVEFFEVKADDLYGYHWALNNNVIKWKLLFTDAD